MAALVARLIVSYRGGAYAGWQRQANALSVQEVLEQALARVIAPEVDPVARPVVVEGASRTDAGVHARGQVVHLILPREFPARALVFGTNTFLPPDVRVLAADRVAPGFHARKHALAKEYRYRLSRAAVVSPLEADFVVAAPRGLDLPLMRAATALVPGRHDFTAFALAGGSHRSAVRRVVAAEWREAGDELTLVITGEGFLRGMVRTLVGTLLEVGRGRRTVDSFAVLLAGRPRGEAGPTAPAHGLVLERVEYGPEWGLVPWTTARTTGP